MNEIELLWLYLFDNATYWDWVRQERAKLDKYADKPGKNFGVWGEQKGKIPTLEDKLQEAVVKYAHMSPEEIDHHKRSHGHCVKTKY